MHISQLGKGPCALVRDLQATIDAECCREGEVRHLVSSWVLVLEKLCVCLCVSREVQGEIELLSQCTDVPECVPRTVGGCRALKPNESFAEAPC